MLNRKLVKFYIRNNFDVLISIDFFLLLIFQVQRKASFNHKLDNLIQRFIESEIYTKKAAQSCAQDCLIFFMLAAMAGE